MRYEGSQPNEKPWIDRILSVINFVLVIVIAFCFNYLYISFLFR